MGHRKSERIETTIVAAVQCVVHVLDTGSGQIVASVPVSLTGSNKSFEFMFQKSGPAILNKLEARAVERILKEIAVTRSPLKLPANPVRVATGRYDGQWEWQKKLSSDQATFSVVVCLPVESARNHFKVSIVPRESREVLAEEQFVWPDGANEHALTFDLRSLVEKHGSGPLTAKLYSGEAPIATCDFALLESGSRG